MATMVNSKFQVAVGIIFEGERLDAPHQIVKTCSLIDYEEHDDMQAYLETLRIQNPDRSFNYLIFATESGMMIQEGEDGVDE